LKENLDVFDFSLTKEEVEKISGLNDGFRVCDPRLWEDECFAGQPLFS